MPSKTQTRVENLGIINDPAIVQGVSQGYQSFVQGGSGARQAVSGGTYTSTYAPAVHTSAYVPTAQSTYQTATYQTNNYVSGSGVRQTGYVTGGSGVRGSGVRASNMVNNSNSYLTGGS